MYNNLIENYSKSIFRIAQKDGKIDDFILDLTKISNNISADFIKIISNPSLNNIILSNISDEIAKKLSLNNKIANFLKIIIKNRRIYLFPEILANFQSIIKKNNNIIDVEIISVNKISDKNLSLIKNIVSKRYPDKIIEIEEVIKKEIIGGFIVKIGSELIDSSIKTFLHQLHIDLKQECYT
jgi:F-type H+-transporting ATPase subunit delta